MGILEGLLNQVTGALQGTTGQQTGLAGSVLNMLTQGGGLQGLVQNMKSKGLGPTIESWISTGPNTPISPQQIEQVLGNAKLQQLAAEHGIPIDELKTHLAQILPVVVDKLTPQGTLPNTGGLGGMLGGLLGGNR